MDVYSAIQRRRSIRRFKQQKIKDTQLIKIIDAARLAPTASNLQPLEYVMVTDDETASAIFPHLKWGKYIEGGDEPPADKRPVAYIFVIINRDIQPKNCGHDVGAAVQNILLAALESGLGTCWLRSVNKKKITDLLGVPGNCELDSVVALGYPAESPRTESMKATHKYWRDDRGLMHVPKRKIDQIVHKGGYTKK